MFINNLMNLNFKFSLIWYLQYNCCFKNPTKFVFLKKSKKSKNYVFTPSNILVKNSYAGLFYNNKKSFYFSKIFFKFVKKTNNLLWKRHRLNDLKFLKYIDQPSYIKFQKNTKLTKNLHKLTTPLNYFNPKEFILKKIYIKKKNKKQLDTIFFDFKPTKQYWKSIKNKENFKYKFKLPAQLSLKNHLIFHNIKTTTLFLKKFKLITSRFLKYDINQVAINYNLRRTGKMSTFLFNKKRQFFSSNLPLNSNQLPFVNKNTKFFHKYVKKFRTRISKRRSDMFWVSQINQKKLTISRRNYRILNRKELIRQKRLTKYITKYYNLKVLNVINSLEFSLINVLMRSGLFNYKPTIVLLMKKNFLYLNNKLLYKTEMLLYKNDIIQCILSIKFILYLKWTTLNNNLNARRFFFYLRKWRNRKFRPHPKQSSYRIPNWIRRRLLYKEPTASYVETDLISLTTVILYDWTFDFFNYHYMSIWQDIPAVVRPLNWKSLT